MQHCVGCVIFQPPTEKKELNILLLGETGVGKSTFINAFVNYLEYANLQEAKDGKLISLIPSSFTMTDENFQQRTITYGSDTNENFTVGQSATQSPISYVFHRPEVTIRIIDTPGIGDSRGIEKDKENMQMIMSHISNYNELHGICILLKPNNARLNVMFSFCVKELLTHLHKDACHNVIFCFTNARGTFYRPGDTLPSLQKLLKAKEKDKKPIPIDIKKETIYCMDNEAFRFLMAFQNGVVFSEKEEAEFDASWSKSMDEYMRLVTHISSLKPHAIKDTLTLNSARRLILDLARPTAEISQAVQINIAVIKEALNEQMSKEDLKKKLYIPAVDLEAKQLDHPTTVCTAPKCVKVVTFKNQQKISYTQRCHKSCNITTEKDKIGCVELQRCLAMQPSGGRTCHVCSCSCESHMHITYETKLVTREVVDDGDSRQLDHKDEKLKAIIAHKKRLLQTKKELENEIKVITKVNAEFACFLKAYAIAPYNDAVLGYLDHLISVEKDKVVVSGNQEKLKRLEELRNTYSEEIKVVQTAIDKGGSTTLLRPEDVKRKISELCQLTHAGPQFNKIVFTQQIRWQSQVPKML